MLLKFTYYAQYYAQEQELWLECYAILYTGLHEQIATCTIDNFRKTVLLECINNEWYLVYTAVCRTMTVLLECIDRLLRFVLILHISNYADIMFNAFNNSLCSNYAGI